MKPRLVIGLALLVGLGAGTLEVRHLQRRSGGLEQVIGDAVSDLRLALPSLVDPIARLEDRLHESWYRLSLRLRGRSAEPTAAGGSADSPEQPAADSGSTALPEESTAGSEGAGSESPAERPASEHPDASARNSGSPPAAADHAAHRDTTPPVWTPVSGGPSRWLEQSWLVANPAFPESPSLVLRVDLKRARIRWQPGTRNPWRMTPQHRMLADASPPPDRSGRIPDDALADTIFAFGGGFESIHFYNYGAIHQGRVIVPLEAGIETFAIYEDGSVRLAPWGSPDLPPDGILEARQNLPPLVHRGEIPPDIVSLNIGTLNATYTLDSTGHRVYSNVHTWRSGLGLTADGDLIYCFGSRLDPRQLAEAMIRAGAVEAMMLDVNAGYHCTPSLIVPAGGARPLVHGLYPGVDAGERFLTGSRKDFFYVRPAAGHGQGV